MLAAFKGTIKPVNWQKAVYELDPDDDSNNGYQNEDLIVWMRTAALPNFRKLYRRVNHTEQFVEGLPKGNYTLLVDYSEFIWAPHCLSIPQQMLKKFPTSFRCVFTIFQQMSPPYCTVLHNSFWACLVYFNSKW